MNPDWLAHREPAVALHRHRILLAVGMVGLLIATGCEPPPQGTAAPIAAAPTAAPRPATRAGQASSGAISRLLLGWTQGPLPPGFADRTRSLSGVRDEAVVVAGTAWLSRSVAPGGSVMDRAPAGFAIPLDVAGADPSAYGNIMGLPPGALKALRHGRALLSRTSAALRRIGPGGSLQLSTGTVQVGRVVADPVVGAHEVFVSTREARSLGIRSERYVVVRLAPGADPARIASRIRGLLPPSMPVRIRSGAATAYLRQADGVMPPEWEKVYFGEFAARPLPDGTLVVDPAWERAHVAEARVPILGRVRCNWALIPPLRKALRALVREHLASLVHPSDYGGCFVPKLVPATGDLSHHAWGSALDLNVSANLLGQTPTQDPRLVRAFHHAGFVWGGEFLVPDGMHFEYGCPSAFELPPLVPVPSPLPPLPLCRSTS